MPCQTPRPPRLLFNEDQPRPMTATPPINPVLADVAARIDARSASLRASYLEGLARMRRDMPQRRSLSCSNMAHVVAACGSAEKGAITGGAAPNLGIVTAYNDMLSAHQPLETFPRLKERLGHGGQQLSGGEQQMLTIGRALMTNPDVLILDEATEGLAPLIAREIWRICSVIKQSGISSIIVDKNWKHVTQITDRNVILVKGQVVFEGSSPVLLADPSVLEQHLGV